jgi:hypothetical protein
MSNFRQRLAKLEAAAAPPAPRWTPGSSDPPPSRSLGFIATILAQHREPALPGWKEWPELAAELHDYVMAGTVAVAFEADCEEQLAFLRDGGWHQVSLEGRVKLRDEYQRLLNEGNFSEE